MVGEAVLACLNKFKGFWQGAGIFGPLKRKGYFQHVPHLLALAAFVLVLVAGVWFERGFPSSPPCVRIGGAIDVAGNCRR